MLARSRSLGDVCIETKLCWEDKLEEAVWDVLELAAITTLPGVAVGYVVYAAPLRRWQPKTPRPVELFADGSLDIVELLGNRHQAAAKVRPLAAGRRLHTYLATGKYRHELADARCVA